MKKSLFLLSVLGLFSCNGLFDKYEPNKVPKFDSTSSISCQEYYENIMAEQDLFYQKQYEQNNKLWKARYDSFGKEFVRFKKNGNVISVNQESGQSANSIINISK